MHLNYPSWLGFSKPQMAENAFKIVHQDDPSNKIVEEKMWKLILKKKSVLLSYTGMLICDSAFQIYHSSKSCNVIYVNVCIYLLFIGCKTI